MNYFEFQKAVFDYLWNRHEKDQSFTFSVRRKASKGAEQNYFIGTQNSGYFGFTCWDIPVYFPGSSADLTNFMFWQENDNFYFKFQYIMSKAAIEPQNEGNKEFGKVLLRKIKDNGMVVKEGIEKNKMFYYHVYGSNNGYSSLTDLFKDFDTMLHVLSPIIQSSINEVKAHNFEWSATTISLNKFNSIIDKMHNRITRFRNAGALPAKELIPEDEDEVRSSQGENADRKFPLNLILFGPPGTGKTFHSIDVALKIVAPEYYEMHKEDRRKLTEKFRELSITDWNNPQGQIAFTTFHQSMSYEDFIEGIKPDLNSGEDISYTIEDGLFKRICNKASIKVDSKDNFNEAYERFLEEIENNGGQIVLKTLAQGKEFTIYENSKKNLRFHANTEKAYQGVIKKDFVASYLQTGDPLDWASYTKSVGEYIKTKHHYNSQHLQTNHKYVLIIDEINRGNVSQIFGELITLVEEDKRAGAEEALEIFLPYSKKPFSVPSNLYIIGTMNTADRSVEALDTALRRRFSFQQMPPDPDLLSPVQMLVKFWNLAEHVDLEHEWWEEPYLSRADQFYNLIGLTRNKEEEIFNRDYDDDDRNEWLEDDLSFLNQNDFTGLNLQTLLEIINKRIEKLLSRDHKIGHSYFMKVDSFLTLKTVFHNKIIPLLQEYFYGDYGKIGLVIGKGFFEENEEEGDEEIFAEFNYEASALVDRKVYILKNIEDMSENEFREAINILLGTKNILAYAQAETI